ncbi:hypothetical protein QQ045_014416 [Rhodiola kirilowii]
MLMVVQWIKARKIDLSSSLNWRNCEHNMQRIRWGKTVSSLRWKAGLLECSSKYCGCLQSSALWDVVKNVVDCQLSFFLSSNGYIDVLWHQPVELVKALALAKAPNAFSSHIMMGQMNFQYSFCGTESAIACTCGVGYSSTAIALWLAVGSWQLAVGSWQLAVGSWHAYSGACIV